MAACAVGVLSAATVFHWLRLMVVAAPLDAVPLSAVGGTQAKSFCRMML